MCKKNWLQLPLLISVGPAATDLNNYRSKIFFKKFSSKAKPEFAALALFTYIHIVFTTIYTAFTLYYQNLIMYFEFYVIFKCNSFHHLIFLFNHLERVKQKQ